MNFNFIKLVVILCTIYSCSGQTATERIDWATEGYNNKRTSYIENTIIKNKPKLRAEKEISSANHAPNAVINGTLYYCNKNNQLSAFDIKTESDLWETDVDFPISLLVVDNNVVYLAGYKDFLGAVVAIDLSTKEKIWEIDKIVGSINGITVANDILIISGHVLMAIEANTGKKIWKFDVEGTQNTVKRIPAIDGEVIYVGSDEIDFFSLDLKTGKEKWRVAISIVSYPVVASNKLILIGKDGFLYCIDSSNGQEIWRYKSDGRFKMWSKKPAVTAEVMYIIEHGYTPSLKLHAIDIESGKNTWTRDYEGYTVSNIVAMEDALLFSITSLLSIEHESARMFAVSPINGKELWQMEIKPKMEPTILVADDAIIYPSEEAGFGVEEERYFLHILK